ncbi:MAG TPA: hypothetical protein PKH10_06830 [bacterium]|nr:hypothetical protein [bacterium]
MIRIPLLAIFLLLVAASLGAEELVINWAVPLKNEFASIKKREFAAPLYRDGLIYVALRDGRLMVFGRDGRKAGERRFTGGFVVPPVEIAGGVLVCESHTAHLLENGSLRDRWAVAGRSPVVARPISQPEGLYLQFLEHTVYLVDPADGAVKANYTFYGESQLSYLMLSQPVAYEDKRVFGFSNGQVFFFLYRKDSYGVDEILPFYKYQTGEIQVGAEKRDFYDIFSLLPGSEGMLLFSNGEAGGSIRVSNGAVTKTGELRNLTLKERADGTVLAYGEAGALVLAKDGTVERRLFSSPSFVTGIVEAGSYALVTEMHGVVSLYLADLSRKLATVRIPQGVSNGGVWGDGAFYLLSDMGTLYSFGVVKKEKDQKILEKSAEPDMKGDSSRTK